VGANTSQMNDSNHRTMIPIRRHKFLDYVAGVRIVPHGGPSPSGNESQTEANQVQGGSPEGA